MGSNWAIAIGINHYENLRSLNFAKRDANVMATWFQQEAKFDQVFLFTDDSPPIPTNPLIDTKPTYGHLRRFLRAQFENIQPPLLNPEDNLWFFFAGHGNRYRDKDYLMFSDSDPGDVEGTAISVDYVTQRLRRSGADNVVLFLDACRDESSRSGLGIGEQRHQGVITFYSCTANQKSWEIEELQHGSFTHALLEGLRLQGEANCATVERLAQYLNRQVPAVNTRYGKQVQNPYLQAEPPYKMYFILLEQTATLRDVEPLKYQASQAENRGNLSLAKQLWVRVLAVSRGDWDAIEAIERIAIRQRGGSEKTATTSEPVASSSGGRSANAEVSVQAQEEHRQKLVQYRQSFSEAVEQEFPLSAASRRRLTSLQQSLQLTNEEVVEIEQPIFAQKRAEYNQRQEEERIRQQQEAEYRQKLRQYEQEVIQTIDREFPLTEASLRKLRNLQQSLQLSDQEVLQIAQPIVVQKEAEYQQQQERIRQQKEAEKQRQQEEALRRQQQQEAEKQRQQEETIRLKQQEAEKKRQRKEAEYRQKLQQYEQTLIKIIRARNFLDSYDVRLRLKILQWTLGLKQTDIAAIQTRVVASYAQPTQSNSPQITRQKFLKWAVLGSGLAIAVSRYSSEIFKPQLLTPEPVTSSRGGRSVTPKLQGLNFDVVTVNAKGREIKREKGQAEYFTEDLGNSATLEMVNIPGGTFMMGTEDKEIERLVKKLNLDMFRCEKPQHQVTVKSFFMAKYPVTQAQWRRVAALPKVKRDLKANPSNFKGDNRPVETISWYDAVEFCDRLSKYTNKQYRLPSEAEWEYACRADTTTPFHFGETITTELANYNGTNTYASELKDKYRVKTTEVGSFKVANSFGLYDMHGNVWEWCQDDWHDSYQGVPTDGSALLNTNSSSTIAVLRGGSWINIPEDCRCASRNYSSRDSIVNHLFGFRVVCVGGRIFP